MWFIHLSPNSGGCAESPCPSFEVYPVYQVVISWKDIKSITKEKTALVIPNAILVQTDSEKHFFASFATRDKTHLMLFRIWQHALMDQVRLRSKPL